ncbi:hypothetical protein AN401_07300 [Zobellella denitrificans]|uniref:Uncharacterized protein n=1 Tax=Zobellella denitrificans TaxID=347534 RepID=A0A291HNK5_9GAMM|nr:hypothetical protein [Zobellella denitrificans]ATG73689.1 hypothetical protein AN401_07300 [Zobellella denitrificans]
MASQFQTIPTAHLGASFRADCVALLEPGVTTAERAVALLGAPYRVIPAPDGDWLYIWQHLRSGLVCDPAETRVALTEQQVMADFDEAGLLLRVHGLVGIPG